VHTLAFGRNNEAVLVEELRKTKRFVPELSLMAKYYEMTVGHILFYPVDIVDGEKKTVTLALAPLAVMPEHQKKGVGSKLIKVGLGKAKKLGFGSVIVLGHEKFYPKFGFQPASKWNIRAPFDVPDEAFMAIELIPGALKDAAGTVHYPKEFSKV
jgi:predicted N-acetyltransferase YhbS